MSELNWTEAHWNRINSAITEEFTKASVAGACLPCYGPAGASMETVSKQTLVLESNGARVKIIDNETIKFWNLRVHVELNAEQVSDENLSSALFAFRRAANLLARTEDYIVFNGHQQTNGEPIPRPAPIPKKGVGAEKEFHIPDLLKKVVANDNNSEGLLSNSKANEQSRPIPKGSIASPNKVLIPSYGETLVVGITEAISQLEREGYPGPFASILGTRIFTEAHTPNPSSLVLPADRITPMLGGPLLRSGSISPNFGVVVPVSGESIDLVVASPPKAQFLQVTDEAKYLFRVYERFALRIKDLKAVVPLVLQP